MDLRALQSEDDYEACMSLQREIWGDDVRETVPAAIMQVTQKVGGIAAGAFERNGELAGFVFGITGIVAGGPAHWSHLLAVRADARDHGVGRALKQHQAEHLRQRGVYTIYWTFDPLESRNAHLNLNRLGAEVIEYVPHMYGRRALAKTDAVIGTDRFIVRWRLDRPAESTTLSSPDNAIVIRNDASAGPDLPTHRGDRKIVVEIPASIQEIKLHSPEIAAAHRARTRGAFEHYLRLGYTVRGFIRGFSGDASAYVLDPPKSQD